MYTRNSSIFILNEENLSTIVVPLGGGADTLLL